METCKYILSVFVGGGVGSLARWGINLWLIPYSEQFPTGTLAANILSCFVVGVGVALANHTIWGSPVMRLLIITGFCGGFSTFSTLIRECYHLVETNRISGMLMYAVVSFVLGLVALLGGLWMGNRWLLS